MCAYICVDACVCAHLNTVFVCGCAQIFWRELVPLWVLVFWWLGVVIWTLVLRIQFAKQFTPPKEPHKSKTLHHVFFHARTLLS